MGRGSAERIYIFATVHEQNYPEREGPAIAEGMHMHRQNAIPGVVAQPC